MGDPAGIGPEISALALAAARPPRRAVVVGDAERLEAGLEIAARAGRLGGRRGQIRVIPEPGQALWAEGVVNVVDLANVASGMAWGELSAEAGRAGYEYLERGVALASAGTVSALCTAPINKEAWRDAGVLHPGHTEALAALTGTIGFAMMLVNQQLRVVHLSTHVSLVEAVARATSERCLTCIDLAERFLRERAGIARPRIAVAGINPHAGEHGLLGGEDSERLLPAVERARAAGWDVSGPWPPDTVFARAASGEFDAVIAAHHDQGHIPIKMLGLDTGVNVTVGLPIVRTSVDHGTAFDIAGTGRARPANLLAALGLAEALAAGQPGG